MRARLRMGKNILELPALQVEYGARGQEAEAGLGELRAPLPRQHRIELLAQRMQVQHVGGGVGKLRLAEAVSAPVARLLLLRQVDVQDLAHQILQPVAISV